MKTKANGIAGYKTRRWQIGKERTSRWRR